MQQKVIIFLFSALFSVCMQNSWADDNANSENKESSVKPSQTGTQTVTQPGAQTKILTHFKNVVLSGLGNLYIRQGKEQGLSVKTEAELLPLISAVVEDDTLKLDFKNAAEHSRAEVNYYLTIKDISSVISYSSSTVYIDEGIETNTLTLEIKSFGDMVVKINVDKLIAKIEGAGKIRASGSARVQEIQITGAGEFVGNDLIGQKASIDIEGTGVAKIKAQDSLNIKIPKEGTVRYCGTPNISKEVSAKAIIEALEVGQCK